MQNIHTYFVHVLFFGANHCTKFAIQFIEAGNQMSGKIPTELGNLELIENLDLRECMNAISEL